VTIAGELRIPKAGNEKLSAVVLLHGSGGVGGTGSMIDEWSRAKPTWHRDICAR
jgi:hypothetical protein